MDLSQRIFNKEKEKEQLINELGIRFPNFAIPKKEISEEVLVSLVLYNLGAEGWETNDGHFFRIGNS